MSQQIIYATLFTGVVFMLLIFLIRRFGGSQNANVRRDKILSSIYTEQTHAHALNSHDEVSILRNDTDEIGRFILAIPFIGENLHDLAMKAGLANRMSSLLIGLLVTFIVSALLLSEAAGLLAGVLGGIIIAFLLVRMYLRRKINKRNETFINMFPDAVDMIVRSVKSGHPLNTALKMIAENMDAPVSTEFRQLVDEIAFGRSTTDALIRLSKRVDEPDLQFFVVILSVQQETGGNLAEVLGNLSNIIRKRKQLRLKIKAMTSEGRATGLILGGLPFLVLGAIQLTSPDYLTPLFITQTGHILLGSAIGLVILTFFIVRSMLQIDI